MLIDVELKHKVMCEGLYRHQVQSRRHSGSEGNLTRSMLLVHLSHRWHPGPGSRVMQSAIEFLLSAKLDPVLRQLQCVNSTVHLLCQQCALQVDRILWFEQTNESVMFTHRWV